MYSSIKTIHSGLAYLVLFLLILSLVTMLSGLFSRKQFTSKDKIIGLITLISTHIQFVLGIIMVSTSPFWSMGMKTIMKNKYMRETVIEHPLIMLIAIILITTGWSKHKKMTTSKDKFKAIAIFYGIGLIVALTRIPWNTWF